MTHFDDTIFAPATVVGTGAVSIIRISGPDALGVVDKVVRFHRGNATDSAGYRLKFGVVQDLDDVVVAIYKAPHSYTGEDSAEIFCHASSFIAGRLFELLREAGARMAEPGEFTRRAYLSGKMDLAQAEAVADVIASASEASHRVAMNQLRGGYSAVLRALREKLLELTSLLELELDFSEEDVEFADRGRLSALLDETIAKVSSLADSFRDGNALKNGVPVAIVGAPNSGKSTLLNALLCEDRAIVSDIAGTTRDTIEETITLGGVLFRFIDTAGIRETSDTVENLGVERSFAAISRADVVLAVIDSTDTLEARKSSLSAILSRLSSAQRLFLLHNKSDLLPHPITKQGEMCTGIDVRELEISAKTGDGLDELKAQLAASQADRFGASDVLVTNARHHEALVQALASLSDVRRGLDSALPTVLLSEHLREALSSLGSITGEISTDDILGHIFEHFCIGK